MAIKRLTAKQEQDLRRALREVVVEPIRAMSAELREVRIEGERRRLNGGLRAEIRRLEARIVALEQRRP